MLKSSLALALGLSRLWASLTGSAIYSLRPFLGCLRGLRMNGVTLNLEGKANETLGVLVNCTGHCRRPLVPCQNYGTCVEHYNHYSCNCSVSAYEGPFCNQGESLCQGGGEGSWEERSSKGQAVPPPLPVTSALLPDCFLQTSVPTLSKEAGCATTS